MIFNSFITEINGVKFYIIDSLNYLNVSDVTTINNVQNGMLFSSNISMKVSVSLVYECILLLLYIFFMLASSGPQLVVSGEFLAMYRSNDCG